MSLAFSVFCFGFLFGFFSCVMMVYAANEELVEESRRCHCGRKLEGGTCPEIWREKP